MSREIKFRVWDKKNKKMYLPEQVSVTILPDDFYHVEDLEGKVLVQPEHVELMQYTGLKDKNGKEIYEGDILNFDWHGAEFNYCKVVFENATFGFYWTNPTFKEDEGFKAFWNTEDNDFDWDLDHAEIIGNIYEHKHLLEAA